MYVKFLMCGCKSERQNKYTLDYIALGNNTKIVRKLRGFSQIYPSVKIRAICGQ
jgi:hypothetical protein